MPIFFKRMFLLFLLEAVVYLINVTEEGILYIIINNKKLRLDTELHDIKEHRLKDQVQT